jgi:hypothetical protein
MSALAGYCKGPSLLARIVHSLRAPWLDPCPIMPFSILANTPGIGSGLKSLAGTILCAIIARSCE